MLCKNSNNCFILLSSKVCSNTEFTRAILARDRIASLIRGFSLIRLAVVENKLPNSFTGSSDSREVVTEFHHDCDSDSISNSDINCIGVSDSEEKSYSGGVRATGACICTQKDWE
jgi:hypothetical protein